MVGSCDSIKGGNFNSISLINRHKLAPKLGLIDLIRVEFLEAVISAGKLLFDVQGQIALEISLHPWRSEKEEARTPSQLLSSEQQGTQAVVFKISVMLGMQPVCAVESTPGSGEPMIKSSKSKCYLNKAKCTHPISFAHVNLLQGDRKICNLLWGCPWPQNSHWECRDLGAREAEPHTLKHVLPAQIQDNGVTGYRTSSPACSVFNKWEITLV